MLLLLFFILFYYSLIFYLMFSTRNRKADTITDKDRIFTLVRQTARWATAADQDENAYIKNLHATYAMGYLNALREVYTDDKITSVIGIDVRQLDKEIKTIMDNAVKMLAKTCPDGQPKNQFLAVLGMQGVI